ncbi:MAG: rod shape-determining protein RodA [Verrucomicrobia bacterium]|nr:rod shape-determining protein RodA [Verrucomicrobiota bacterium]
MFAATYNERAPRPDGVMLGALLLLMSIGAAFIYSATMANAGAADLPLIQQRHIKQIVWYLLGGSAAVLLCLVDYRSLARWSLVAYWANVLVLAAVLVPGIGSMRFGARRWIDLGVFQLQPSEFAKLSFILVMAHFLSRPLNELREPRQFFKALGLIALPFALVLKEPDLGSALMFPLVGFAMMVVAEVPKKFLLRLAGGLGLVLALVLVDVLYAPEKFQFIKLESYQRHRLMVYFGKDFAPPQATAAERQRARELQRQKSYNVEQALISVGSGGPTGKGWRQGTQNALGYLPRAVAHNDFIFSVIAEESGFVGSVIVLTLYAVVLFSGIRIAGQARDRLGKLLAAGIVALLFSHVFINIGMNIRLMPVTGVPLPLLSYGGSSVLCSLIAAGVLQNIHLYRRAY